ncbi:MAG: DinB family protein [Bacteroidetes bacterium]|nr:MAG: DinB family protein [Bacteroidota bacterium]
MEITSLSLRVLSVTHQNMLRILESLSDEDLNRQIPGINNTIAWNFGHTIVTCQLLVLKLSGQELQINLRQLAKFRKDSDGKVECTREELMELSAIHQKFMSDLPQLAGAGALNEYEAYETSYGASLYNAQEAVHFAGVHAGLHLGYMMAMRRAMGK